MDMFDEDMIFGDSQDLLDRSSNGVNIFKDFIDSEDEDELVIDTGGKKGPLDLVDKPGPIEFEDNNVKDNIDTLGEFNFKTEMKKINSDSSVSSLCDSNSLFSQAKQSASDGYIETDFGTSSKKDWQSFISKDHANSAKTSRVGDVLTESDNKMEKEMIKSPKEGASESDPKTSQGQKKELFENNDSNNGGTLSDSKIDWEKVWSIIEDTEKHISGLSNNRNLFRSLLQDLASESGRSTS